MDAGERIRLRTELAQLQHGLGVTAIYVTHDQSQAMAIGDRVAVMRAGRIEQVDEPRTLYLRPANTFVASFMGEPAMNLLSGYIEEDASRTWVVIGGQRLPFPGTPSGLVRGRSGPVTVGIRPEHFEDAARMDGHRGEGLTFKATVDVLESLGADKYAYFRLQGPGSPPRSWRS